MIVPMKKLSLVTMKRLEEATLYRLRDLGVLHVERSPGVGGNGDALREQITRLERALSMVPPPDGDDASSESRGDGQSLVDEALEVAQRVEALAERRTTITETQDRLSRAIERMEPWGDVSPVQLEKLADAGVRIRLYALSTDEAADIDLPGMIVLHRDKFGVRLVSIALGDETVPETPAPFALPESSLTELREKYRVAGEEIRTIEDELSSLTSRRGLLKAALEELDEDLEYAEVEATTAGDDELSWLTGYLPHDAVDTVRDAARENGWGLVIRDPDEEDPVPTEVRNPKAVNIIRPVFGLLGTIPGYREFDISLLFLVFLTAFFAMIIGDGGYGAVILLGTLYGAIKTKIAGKTLGEGQLLLLVFSLATVAWGAVTGNWFGYAPFAELPILRDLVVPHLSAQNEISTYTVKYVCFVIGTVHLAIAHIWGFFRGLRRAPRIAALAQLGWLSLVLGLYYLVLQLVLDPSLTMPPWALPMIGGGLGTVIVFGAQESGTNFFVGIAKGFANIITTILDGVSAFSDIISYIRLYAVGLASLAIAAAFNDMATGLADSLGGVVGVVAAAIVLVLGHTLNLAMGALAVVVHGVRLNMLEFSGHLGMEWTGVQYTPFKSRGKQGEVA